MTARTAPLRVANCSGFFGDRPSAARELLDGADFDVLTGDWLAELTMLILARQRAKNPAAGYARTFLTMLEDVLGTCVQRGIPIVANAGGLNPAGCATAVSALAARLGLSVTVGSVDGDDLLPKVPDLLAAGRLSSLSGDALHLSGPALVANAYLGGWGIASCLSRGANVVVTGRVTDAALTIGPAAWAFDWARDDWDALAGALVAGHIIECGAQATGGNYSFADRDAPGMTRPGFPIAEINPDGSSVITKPRGSDGVVNRDTVTAQLLYEVGPARYLNPDVTARLDTIELVDDGPDRVLVRGVRGEPPPERLKVSLAVDGGFRNAMMLGITGTDPVGKARLAEREIWDQIPGGRYAFEEVSVELLGRPADDMAGQPAATCLLRIAVAGTDRALVGRTFSSAVIATGLSSYAGLYTAGPPSDATSFARYVPALVPADACAVTATVGESVVSIEHTPGRPSHADVVSAPRTLVATPVARVPLARLIGARSGDKGGDANVGVWCSHDAVYAWLESYLDVARMRELLPETAGLTITRHPLPNLRAINFVIERFLGDGVASCLRFDAQAKGLAEYLRSRVVDVPTNLVTFEVQP
ncbi:MAG TPA: acyclic terpene utilization AtuA family protein [Micromonosporaceae bacterium]